MRDNELALTGKRGQRLRGALDIPALCLSGHGLTAREQGVATECDNHTHRLSPLRRLILDDRDVRTSWRLDS
jgi:hypothetical protein